MYGSTTNLVCAQHARFSMVHPNVDVGVGKNMDIDLEQVKSTMESKWELLENRD